MNIDTGRKLAYPDPQYVSYSTTGLPYCRGTLIADLSRAQVSRLTAGLLRAKVIPALAVIKR